MNGSEELASNPMLKQSKMKINKKNKVMIMDKGFYKTVKTSLKSVLKNPEINLRKIQDAVIRTNKIITHSLQFLKLFLLHRYESGTFPQIDKTLIRCALKTCSVGDREKKFPKTKDMMEDLSKFYNTHYLPHTWDEIPNRIHLKEILKYAEEDIITMYENNVKLHFVEYVERYVNVIWKKKFKIELIKKIAKTKEGN
jgi:hypothetical protein